MAWLDLQGEIADTFETLSGCVEVAELGHGFGRARHLTTTRATVDGSRPGMTDEQRKAKRRELEANRRAYKAAKQREYYARRKAAA